MQIGKHEVALTPIKVKGLKLDKDSKGKKELYVDAKGDAVSKIQIVKGEYRWVYTETAKPYDGTAFKSYKGKPINKFEKTNNVETYEVEDIGVMYNLVENEATYLVTSDSLKQELKELEQAITFKYTNGNGFKFYKAVVYYDHNLDRVLMRCFRGDLTKIDLSEKPQKEITAEEEVNRLSLDDMEV